MPRHLDAPNSTSTSHILERQLPLALFGERRRWRESPDHPTARVWPAGVARLKDAPKGSRRDAVGAKGADP